MRTRAAGLRGAKLRPAEAFSRPKFKISCGIKGQARSRSLLPGVRCRARSVRTGSPQPLPGGGLQLASCRSARASPSARLRVCLTSRGDAVRHRRAAFTDALCCIFDLEEVGGPQPPPGGGPQLASRRSASSAPSAGCVPSVLRQSMCGVWNRSVRTGSPQPPLGGGLLLYVASPSARLRACLATEIDLEEVGGPQPPPAEARSSLASLAYLRRLRPENAVRCGVCGVELGRSATGSPQPPPGGGLHPRAARKQARPLGCGPASVCRPGKEKRPIQRPGQAFRNPESVSEKRKNGPSRRKGRSNSGRARINISRRCRNTSDGRPGCRSWSHTTRD